MLVEDPVKRMKRSYKMGKRCLQATCAKGLVFSLCNEYSKLIRKK